MTARQKYLLERESVVNPVGVDATDRVRQRLRDLSTERRFKQTKLAARLGIDQGAVNRYIKGTTPITISFLEAVELEAGVPLAELVAPPGTIHQLNPDEAALIRWLRRWPLSITRALCAFLAFFADEPSEVRETRNMHELWRGLQKLDREWLYGLAVMLREGTVAPDLRSGVVDQMTAEGVFGKRRAARHDDPGQG